MPNQLTKPVTVSLTQMSSAANAASSKPTPAGHHHGSAVSGSSAAVQSQSSNAAATQKPAAAASAALNKTFEKETPCESLVTSSYCQSEICVWDHHFFWKPG